jgi:diguanylate cyclase (GGDEF)-like protein
MAAAWAQASRSGDVLSLVMFDVDDFKPYNDAYGHLQGDACLQQVATLLGEVAIAPDALIARFGGEEFALMLPRIDAAGARAIAEDMRARLAGAGIVHPHSRTGGVLTMSAGIGTTTPAAGQPWLAFVETVDRHLYLAKDAGRNRIVAAS